MDVNDKKKELIEIGMLDEVRGIMRDCIMYIMDIKFVGRPEHFNLMYKYVFQNKIWLREGIGEELVEEILTTIEIPPYHRLSYEWKLEKLDEIMEKLKKIREDLREEEIKIYH